MLKMESKSKVAVKTKGSPYKSLSTVPGTSVLVNTIACTPPHKNFTETTCQNALASLLSEDDHAK